MGPTKTECERLNELLKDKDIDLPDFRRNVTHTGSNVAWLKKHIQLRNPNLHPEIRQILKLV